LLVWQSFSHHWTWLDQKFCTEAVTGHQLLWQVAVSYIKDRPEIQTCPPSEFWTASCASKKAAELASDELRLVQFSSCQYVSLWVLSWLEFTMGGERYPHL